METIIYPTKTKAIKPHQCMFCLQPIDKGSTYLKSTHKLDGQIYAWKTHEHCSEIAHKLNMWDDVDEGVNSDVFIEFINNEYDSIMSKTQTEIWESKDFIIPKFNGRLLFVMNHHSVLIA